MADYWFGACVGWLLGVCVARWLYRDQVKSLREQVSVLEEHIRRFI